MLESVKITAVSRLGGMFMVSISGSITTGTYDALEEGLCGLLRAADLCLDLRDVNRCSSVGLGMFYRLGDMADELGRRIFVLRPSPVVRRGLAPGGLASVFRFIDDEAELETYS